MINECFVSCYKVCQNVDLIRCKFSEINLYGVRLENNESLQSMDSFILFWWIQCLPVLHVFFIASSGPQNRFIMVSYLYRVG